MVAFDRFRSPPRDPAGGLHGGRGAAGMGARFASAMAALCAAAALSPPAGALPVSPLPRRAAAAIPVLLVCDADGCRHRFNGYRARPNWNGYWARRAEEAAAPARPAASRSRR